MDVINEFVSTEVAIDVLRFFVLIGSFYAVYRFFSAPRGIPKGPRGLPVVGYLPYVTNKPFLHFMELGKMYGNVFSFYLGDRLTIVLNDFDAIKEAFVFQGDVFSGRPTSMNLTFNPNDNLSFAAKDGPYWLEHRKVLIDLTKDLRFSKLGPETLIQKEVEYLLQFLSKYESKPTDIRLLLNLSVCNNMCTLAFGKRFNYNEARFIKLTETIREFSEVSNNLSSRIFFPYLKHLPGFGRLMKIAQAKKSLNQLEKIVKEFVDEKKKTYVAGQRSDYIEAYLTERKLRMEHNDPTSEFFTEKALLHNLRSIIGAGTETTSNTLMWALIFMMRHPDIQLKVQKELDDVIEGDRLPSWNDNMNTPFTEATLLEIQRMASPVPLSLAHRNIENTQLLGFKIPKDSYVVANIWNVHHDPDLWKDSEEFCPERFLTENGKLFKPEFLIPFSLGKRQCPAGDYLARMELYIYFASMLKKFAFIAPNEAAPNLDAALGISLIPKSFVICAVPRK